MAVANKKLIFTEESLQDFEKHTKTVVRYNDIEEAEFFVRKIWPDIEVNKELAKNNPDAFIRLERIYNINQILIIGILPEKELLFLCEKGLGWYFSEMIEDIDLWEKIRAKLTSLEHTDRDILKEKIRKVILRNNDRITERKIIRNNNEYAPTIAQWLVDYTSAVGVGMVEVVKINEYFTQSQNFQKLSAAGKNRVRVLVNVYEKLKKSSLTPEGLEEAVTFVQDGKEITLSEGNFENYNQKISEMIKKFEKAGLIEAQAGEEAESLISDVKTTQIENQISQAAAVSAVEQEVLAAYQGDPRQVKAITKEEQKLAKKFSAKGEAIKLRAEFFKAVQKKNVNQTIAILRLLTQQKDLENFIAKDAKLNQFLTAIWEKQYGKSFAAEFNQKPAQLKFVRQFLRYVLEERLGMPKSDAARIGLQIGNIFVSLGQKGYNKMAYFDVKGKEFRWFEG